jgi:DNA-nicking Smr family endonuclease
MQTFFVVGELELKLIGGSKDRSPREIDLHGLYVKEAIAHTDAAIQTAKKRGESDLRLIVGPSEPQLFC